MKTFIAFCFCLAFILPASHATAPAPGKGTLYLEDVIAGGLRLSWLYLGDDGSFVRDPHFGVDPVNMTLEKQKNADNTGTYTKTADKIMVTYTNGKKETWKIEYLNGKINTVDGWFISQQSPLAANYKLNGSFSAPLFFGYISRVQTYTFSNDGTLTIQMLAGVKNGTAGAVATGTQKGTYNIKGNTLTVKLENGETTMAVIGLLPGAKPSVIINNEVFK